MIDTLFSTAPARDLTQICFSQDFRKEYMNKKKGSKKRVGFIHSFSFRLFLLLASSNSFEEEIINIWIKKKINHGTRTV